ncbi:uncharacterized protein I303_106624 [Kwoniella dejecticola CBS 10117]|uniref:Small secreted protein n=1 Tax=Kwoniella dejecticola CBS 10117 TaxID=1296121 RepID=A0A1A5ZU60_9TREE|nr:uncharacterized protein I303_08117 [Kwoniella dejecticola CBS 10117]OBR81347.1 hypothetical protein I303_08117 [Kwoniella dejecticola CBS 10117]
MLFKYLFSVLPLLAFVAATPTPVKRQAGRCPTFALQDYAAFQISDGVAGNAEAEANAVFVDPFAGCDLATVDADSLDNMKAMREAAEDAETELFNPQIDAADGAAADSLQIGKIKNKVLKLTGFNQVLRIQAAQGEDTADKLAEEQTKLDKNIATDEASAGEASTAAVGGGGANAAAAAVADAADDDEAGSAATVSSSANAGTCTCAN